MNKTFMGVIILAVVIIGGVVLFGGAEKNTQEENFSAGTERNF